VKVYIASSLGNVATVQRLRDLLVSLGHEITHDWTVVEPGHANDPRAAEHPGFPDSTDPISITLEDRADADIEGVVSADALIAILPGGVGTHTELGAALGWNRCAGDSYGKEPIKVFLWAAGGLDAYIAPGGYPCAFWLAPCVHLVDGDAADMLAAFEFWAKQKGAS